MFILITYLKITVIGKVGFLLYIIKSSLKDVKDAGKRRSNE